jgi:lysophospholipase L1-like esterase
LLLFGVAGFVTLRERFDPSLTPRPALGAFWRARGPLGWPLVVAPNDPAVARGLSLAPDARLQLVIGGPVSLRYDMLEIELAYPDPGGALEIVLGEQGGDRTRVVYARTAESFEVRAERRRNDAPAIPLGEASRPDWRTAGTATHILRVQTGQQRTELTLDGTPLLGWDDAAGAEASVSVLAREAPLELVALRVEGMGGPNDKRFRQETDFAHLRQRGSWQPRAIDAVFGLAAILLSALWLASLCPTRPTPALLLRATCRLLGPTALVLAAAGALVRADPALVSWLHWGLGAAALVGMAGAMRALRPVPDAPPDGRPEGRALATPIAFVLVGVSAFCAGRQALVVPDEPAPGPMASQPAALEPPTSIHQAEPLTLDAASAFIVPAAYRDILLNCTVLVREGSVLGVRLRAPRTRFAEGALLVLSTDERMETRFVHESEDDYRAVGDAYRGDDGRSLVTPGRHELTIRANGRQLVAELDGRPLCRTDDRAMPQEGGLVMLSLRGAVDVLDVSIKALPTDPDAPVDLAPMARAAAIPFSVWLLYALAAAWLLGVSLPSSLSSSAFALLPLAAAWLLVDENGELTHAAFGTAAGAAIAMLFVQSVVHTGIGRRGRGTALILISLALPPTALALSIEKPLATSEVWLDQISHVDWSGDRLHEGLMHLEHPLLRRRNTWLGDHRFHGRQVTEQAHPDVSRVISLGASGTWGWGYPVGSRNDYPSRLQALLMQERPVEVINASWVGSSGDRLFRFLRDGLAPLQPDVVTLSAYYADAIGLSQGDEEAYLAHAATSGYERSWWDDARERRRLAEDRDLLKRIAAVREATDEIPHDLLERLAGDAHPPERFAAMLRRFAELSRERGFGLVLMKEPVSRPEAFPWKREFDAVMDEVAAEYGLVVVDPAAALAAEGASSVFLDAVHPSARGHEIIARELLPAVRAALPGR